MAEKLLHTPLCDMLGIKYPILLAGMVSRCMTGKPVRQLKNKWSEEFEASGLQPLPMPFQSLIAFPILEAARQAGMKDVYPGIAGQSVGLLTKIRPAREIVEEMVSQAVEILSERFPRTVQFHA